MSEDEWSTTSYSDREDMDKMEYVQGDDVNYEEDVRMWREVNSADPILNVTAIFPDLLMTIDRCPTHDELVQQTVFTYFRDYYFFEGKAYYLIIDQQRFDFPDFQALFFDLTDQLLRKGIGIETRFYLDLLSRVIPKIEDFLTHNEQANDLAKMISGL